MNSPAKKFLLLALAALLLTANGFLLPILNRERARLGITRIEPLENAPPVLALTTQVLGGFRGLIANALWIRSTQLQEEGKYFEMVQLADWITKLEPHIITVWQVQSWNMAFNISVKFPDHADRWRWVQRGIELLRDDALRYNPDQPLIYADLEWLFRFKMGQNLDDGHFYYKWAWATEMVNAFGGNEPDFDRLIHPQTPEEKERAGVLRQKYKLDPAWMKTVDERYGPLDWRLPESHALYWSSLGLQRSRKEEDARRLRQGIYQGLQLSFQRGRLYLGSNGVVRLFPNLDIADKVRFSFEEQLANSPDILTNSVTMAYRNFLRDAPYQFFLVNRLREAEQWLVLLRQKFPESTPPEVTLAEYAVTRAMDNVQDQSQVKVAQLLQGFVINAYIALLEDKPDESNEYLRRAHEFHDAYVKRTKDNQRIRIDPVETIQKQVVEGMLSPGSGLSADARRRLRTLVNLPPEPPATAPNQNK